MKAKVIQRFTDLKANKVREVGDTFEVTQARFDELQKIANLLEIVEEKKKAAKKKSGD